MNRNIIHLMAGFLVTVILSMAGCGDGSSPLADATMQSAAGKTSYAGNISQAVITANNAKALSTDAYHGVQTVSYAAEVEITTNGSQPSPPRVQELSTILESSIQSIVKKTLLTAKVVAATVAETTDGVSGHY